MEIIEFPHEIKIYVPTIDDNCNALKALDTEGIININYSKMIDDYDYGKYLSSIWKKGKSFILLEHDIIPWPGAIYQLRHCDQNWCVFPYSYDGGCCFNNGLALVKISRKIIESNKDWPYKYEWSKKHWSILVDYIVNPLKDYYKQPPHVHYPAVAHLKGKHKKYYESTRTR